LDATGVQPYGTDLSSSMDTLYGYTSSTELETFVYSGRIDCRFVIPSATLTGTLYQGKLRLGQFFQAHTGSSSDLQMPLSALIRAADSVKGMQSGFSLQSAMVNDYILTHTVKTGDDKLIDYLRDNELGSEIIDYVILQSPAVNISTGGLQTYSLVSEVFYNSAVLPSTKNLLLYRTFESMPSRKQIKEIDYAYSPIDPIFLDTIKKPLTTEEVKEFNQDITKATFLNFDSDLVSSSSRTTRASSTERRLNDLDVISTVTEESKCTAKVISRKKAALLALISSREAELRDLGMKMPLHLSEQGWAIANGAFMIAKEAANDERVRRYFKKKKDAFIKAAEHKRGNFVAKMSAGVKAVLNPKKPTKIAIQILKDMARESFTYLEMVNHGSMTYEDFLKKMKEHIKAGVRLPRAVNDKRLQLEAEKRAEKKAKKQKPKHEEVKAQN